MGKPRKSPYAIMEDGSSSHYLSVDGYDTRVRCWGGALEAPFPEKTNRPLILCFTGNPGLTNFYRKFLSTIYKKLDYRIWAISHAGHDPPTASFEKRTNNDDQLFSLAQQIEHKRKFIQDVVPKHLPLVFIGHSIGAHIAIQLLREDDVLAERVRKVYCLFPTIENMRLTTNGYIFETFVQCFIPLIIFISWLFVLLPRKWRYFLIDHYFRMKGYSPNCVEAAFEMIQPKVLNQVFYMASDELKNVRDLDKETLSTYSDKFRLLYTARDGWVPKGCPEQLKKLIPSLNNRILDTTGEADHAFVLKRSVFLGEKIITWLKDDLVRN